MPVLRPHRAVTPDISAAAFQPPGEGEDEVQGAGAGGAQRRKDWVSDDELLNRTGA